MKSITLAVMISRWAVGVRYEDLPDDVVRVVKRAMIDYLGAALKGSKTNLSKAVQVYLSNRDGECAVLGTDQRLSPAEAAFANGVAAAVLEFDDGHSQATIHPGATCIPSIFAAAEFSGATFKQTITAIAVAYEISSRLGVEVSNLVLNRGFHCTPIVGAFASTIGVSKVIGNDEMKTSSAIGITGSQVSGLFDYQSDWQNAWSISIGGSNRSGTQNAFLAKMGVKGPINIFEGDRGVGLAFTGEKISTQQIMEKIGEEWVMLGTSVKAYPSCRRSHSAIDATLLWKKKNNTIDLGSIKKIIVETSKESARLSNKIIETLSAAQMSIPYCVAVALAKGCPKLEHFTDVPPVDLEVKKFIDQIDVVESDDPDINEAMNFSSRVIFKLDGGVSQRVDVLYPRGDSRNPMTDDELENKFCSLAVSVVGRERCRELLGFIFSDNEFLNEPLSNHVFNI